MAEIEKTEQEKASAEQGKFSAELQKTGEYTAEKTGEYTAENQPEQEPQQEQVGSFHAKAHEKKDKEKGPSYNWLQISEENDAAEWLIAMLKGPLQNWLIGNLEFVSYYVGKGLDKGVEFVNKKREKEKLGKDKDGKDNKNKDEKGKDNKGKGSGPKKTSAQDRNDHKAQKAQDLVNKAKKNMANRKYDNSTLGKNQKAYDQMTVESLQHEADYRQKVAANPDYAKSPEGRKARAELVGDRRALAAMQKETGVNNKIVDGDIKKKTKAQKAAQKARIGLKAAGLAARDQKKKITNKVKQAHQKGMKKLKQKANLKVFSNLKAHMKNIAQKKSRPQSRQQGNSMANTARKKQNTGR
ncbi:MAG: hypothetical protein IJY17_10420 [Alphaproteobacteria bacterium]|nr:hypothetical protein [Alphaproteobacteria bacterium]